MGGYKPRLLTGELRDWLTERARCDFTLRGLAAELGERGVEVDYVQVWWFVHAEGLSFKKNVLPAEQLRPAVARRRARWKKYQSRLDPARLVFIDETWRLSLPLGHPSPKERDDYVPNVVYSCGGMIHDRTLPLPYRVADSFTTFAHVALGDLLGAME